MISYTEENIQRILQNLKHCSVVIDNNEGLEEMQRQIDAAVCAI